MNLLLPSVLAGMVVAISALRWRWSVYAVLVLVVIEGALRKWVFPGQTDLLYFAKDVVLVGAYLGYLSTARNTNPRLQIPARLPGTLVILNVILISAQISNPNHQSLLMALFGLKAYLFYIPLAWLAADLFRTTNELRSFLRFYTILAIGVGLLGVWQFSQPPDSFWNVYAHDMDVDGVATFGGEIEFARITGTFAYIHGYAVYLVVMSCFLLPLAVLEKSKGWKGATFLALLLMLGNISMTGSRSPVLYGAVVLAGFVIVTGLSSIGEERRLARVTAAVAVVGVVTTLTLFGRASAALKDRAEEDWDTGLTRMATPFIGPVAMAGLAGWGGYGPSTGLPSMKGLSEKVGLAPPRAWAPDPLWDSEQGRVLTELGLPMTVLWYALVLSLPVLLWRTRNRLRDPWLRQMALGAFLIHLCALPNSLTASSTVAVYVWFTAGFIVLLPRLQAQVGPAAPNPSKGRQRNGRAWNPTSPNLGVEGSQTTAPTETFQNNKERA